MCCTIWIMGERSDAARSPIPICLPMEAPRIDRSAPPPSSPNHPPAPEYLHTRSCLPPSGRRAGRAATSVLISAEAHGNYVLLQQKSGSYLLRETISGIAEKLRPYGFIRIHRSVLVNVAFVDTIQPGAGSEYLLRTKTGRQYHVTRTYRKNLRGLAQFWIGTEGFDSD